MLTRKMQLSDVSDVYNIEEKSFSMPWSLESFEKEITINKAAHYFVIEVSNKVVGYMGIWKILDEGHITNIAIDPSYRGKRYGAELLKFVLEQMKQIGVESFTLEVRASNEVAIKLYEKFGFITMGIRKKYYTDTQEDALLMWKNYKKVSEFDEFI